ncbi:MAG: MFS transporter [Candidatus Colwellbacteria bacterium]|nr:MFS transporter [Candidatus Colwellbacteria bacterium]
MNEQKKKKREIAVILLTNLINVIGMSVVIPTLPFYVESMGLNAAIITTLFAVFSLCSFVSSPFLGSLSEKYGRRPILMASIASTCIGWLIFALARNPALLFLGRMIDGLAAGNFSIAQNIIGDIAEDKKERTRFFGFFGATFAIGFIIGPALGGILATISPTAPFFAVSILALINLLLVYLIVPETNKHIDRKRKIDAHPLIPIYRVLSNNILRRPMFVWLFFMLAMAGVQSIGSLYLKERFDFGPSSIGIFMTAASIVMILNQAIGMRIWTDGKREGFFEKAFLLIVGIGYIMLGGSPVIAILGVLAFTIAEGTLRAILSDRMFSGARPQERGELVGVQSSVMSLACVIAPVIAGSLFLIKPEYPFIMSFIFAIIAFVASLKFPKREYHPMPGTIEDQVI